MSEIPPVALVTGGARRIGRTLVLRLAALGFDTAVHCRDIDEEARTTARAVESSGRRAVLLPADLTDEAAVTDIVPRAMAALGPVGVLVNNASIFQFDRLASMTRESWDRHIAINLRAPAVLCQAFVRQLPETSDGLIVNIVDERVTNLTPNYLSYSVSKVGLWALTQVLARELAPRIRVNAIGPGPALAPPGWSEAQFQALVAKLPLDRGTDPDELADALAFILGARSMTGHLLIIDGGQHMGWLTPRGTARE